MPISSRTSMLVLVTALGLAARAHDASARGSHGGGPAHFEGHAAGLGMMGMRSPSMSGPSSHAGRHHARIPGHGSSGWQPPSGSGRGSLPATGGTGSSASTGGILPDMSEAASRTSSRSGAAMGSGTAGSAAGFSSSSSPAPNTSTAAANNAAGQPSGGPQMLLESSGGSAPTDPHPGGGGDTLAACMGFWDAATHMSRPEWRDTCKRTLNGINLPTETGGAVVTTSGHAGAHRHARRSASTRKHHRGS